MARGQACWCLEVGSAWTAGLVHGSAGTAADLSGSSRADPSRPALTAKCVCVLSLSPNKDRGAAANNVVSALKLGHHSDGGRLPENPRVKSCLNGQESDTHTFMSK